MKSLAALKHNLSSAQTQLEILERKSVDAEESPILFQQKLEEANLYPLLPTRITTLQINLGKMCNQVCKHCHVDAGPDRKEIMTLSTMQACLDVLADHPDLQIVDLTGGAPEMNPHFRWMVSELKKLNRHVIVRCNLTILKANKKYYDLPEFYKQHDVEIVSSLPFYTKGRTDKQRGDGVFEDSIQALQMLNQVGYGSADGTLKLHLVYNPSGAFLPPSQDALEKEFKEALLKDFNIRFNQLYTITNLPISRFLDFLLETGNYENYMMKLIDAFNPAAATNVMCRSILSIGWDGYIYDCDFNQMLELKVDCSSKHISNFSATNLSKRNIIVKQHCFGCTAGAGSSCGGSLL